MGLAWIYQDEPYDETPDEEEEEVTTEAVSTSP